MAFGALVLVAWTGSSRAEDKGIQHHGEAHAGGMIIGPLGESRAGQRAEFRVDGVPTVRNPFDPDAIRVDATFEGPSGVRTTVPGFWYQEFSRSLVAGAEVLEPAGEPHWRVRFLPLDAGSYALTVSVSVGGGLATSTSAPAEGRTSDNGSAGGGRGAATVAIRFSVAAAAVGSLRGPARVAADGRAFETPDGRPLPIVGANVCWGGARGTYDFDDWFPAAARAGWNTARLWQSPWSMGIEHDPETLNRYSLKDARQLDHVFDLALRKGLYLLLSLDHHGMYLVDDPAWGGSNNFWRNHNPYSRELGGPCADPNEFFTSPVARRLYEKRLRYLVARWGASPHLLAWQFFNEIDNAYVPRGTLVAQDVADWHRAMGQWLRANDPYHHLISTSLTGGSDRPEIWSLPEMDFTVYHSYAEGDPARRLALLSDDLVRRYSKPAMVGEFGINARAWNPSLDPHLRGFRQGLWGGVLGGSVGTPLSWWWEDLHADDVYPLFGVLRDIMRRAGWGEGRWQPVRFVGDYDVPKELGLPIDGGDPFDVDLSLNVLRLNPVPGEIAVAHRLAAQRGAERISAYLHAAGKAPLQSAMKITAWFAEGGRISLRVNSVAADANLVVTVDGGEVLRECLLNVDGRSIVNGEIDKELAASIPVGRHEIVIAHDGSDWVNLDAVRLQRVRPATFAGGWRFRPEPIGLSNGQTMVVYVHSPHVAWPAGAIRHNPPTVTNETVALEGWPKVTATAEWFSPETGAAIATTQGRAIGGALSLPLPAFKDDLVAIVR